MAQYFLFATNALIVVAAFIFIIKFILLASKGYGPELKTVLGIILFGGALAFIYSFYLRLDGMSQGKDVTPSLFFDMAVYTALLIYSFYIWNKKKAELERDELAERIRKDNELIIKSQNLGK